MRRQVNNVVDFFAFVFLLTTLAVMLVLWCVVILPIILVKEWIEDGTD